MAGAWSKIEKLHIEIKQQIIETLLAGVGMHPPGQ